MNDTSVKQACRATAGGNARKGRCATLFQTSRRAVLFSLVLALATTAGCRLAERPRALPGEERPLVVSHRGGRAEYDDNAAGGFAKGLAAGIRSFETDIRMTKDRRLVIMHDARVDRTTTSTGIVEEMTFADVTALKLKRSGENVPSLDTLLALFKGRGDIRLELEMKTRKSPHYDGENRTVYCRLLHETAARLLEPGTYVFTSFDAKTLAEMKRLYPDAPTMFITGKACTKAFVDKAVSLGCRGIAVPLRKTSRELIGYAHGKGLSVSLWMVQNKDDYAMARELGCDTATSDRPIALLDVARAERRLPRDAGVDNGYKQEE